MDKVKSIERLQKQISESHLLHSSASSNPEFKKWKRNTELAIESVFGNGTRHLTDFSKIRWTPTMYNLNNSASAFSKSYRSGLESSRAVLESMCEEIEEYWDDSSKQVSKNNIDTVTHLCSRFHLVARQLRSRYNSRSTIEVEDEYDVQDLFHALLKVEFDDIRPEEWTPSYAGKCSRVDFLLKDEQIIIEVKKTRKGLGPKQLGDQLIIDIARYKAHPDCSTLICFVYDPEGRVGNPSSIEKDLNGKHDDIDVIVLVVPRGL